MPSQQSNIAVYCFNSDSFEWKDTVRPLSVCFPPPPKTMLETSFIVVKFGSLVHQSSCSDLSGVCGDSSTVYDSYIRDCPDIARNYPADLETGRV